MGWHDLDLAVLTLLIVSLLGRKYFYRFMFPEVRSENIDRFINKKTSITIIIIATNLLVLLAEAAGFLSTRNFWIVLAVVGAPAIVCLPFFLGQEITLIKERRWTKPH
jgi:hypothetical protein